MLLRLVIFVRLLKQRAAKARIFHNMEKVERRELQIRAK